MAKIVPNATRSIFLFCTILAVQAVCTADMYDVYLLAGQSNMDGRGAVSDLPKDQKTPVDNAIIFYRNASRSSGGWQPLAPGFSVPPKYKGEFPSPTFGPEIGFARSMLKSQPKRRLALIKGSKGGTSLRADWKPGVKDNEDSQGPQYRDFIQTIRLATKQLREQGDQFTIRGLLWHQGESDSKSSTEVYSRRLKVLIDRIREDVGVPDLPIVVGEVFDNGKRDSVRSAIQAAAAESPTVGLVTSDDTSTSDPGTHFDAKSQLLLGERYASAISRLHVLKKERAAAAKSPEELRPTVRPEQPNVIIIYTDDLGWQDLKCYDVDEPCPYDTPHLDAFAKKSVMFWQAYSPAPTCSPSRCAVMSGVHPARAQKTHVVGGHPPHPHNIKNSMMDPWYSGRMPADTFTLARAMKANGYTTGHVGKWHIAISHHAFPQPLDVGFDFTRSDRGAHRSVKDRLKGFATSAEDDPFRLDENGFPFHQNSEDALHFIREFKSEPFFLYYCTWLVHAPIFTRNEALLQKYVDRMGVDPANTNRKEVPGQLNPFYGAMVESLDYYVGQVFNYLDTTDDPRWPGHRLSENTYVIFTSDNGGMEGSPVERYTDNNPLDRGKISAKEGGTRVPLFVAGPGIRAGVQTDVMVNGLDFYPTILSLTGAKRPQNKTLDGCDLAPLLLNDPTDPNLVKHADGSVRDTMMWHFPHGSALESTLRVGDFKLIRNYDHVGKPDTPKLELFQLYKTVDGTQQRVDIEEAKNLADVMPEKTQALNQKLTNMLTEMNASYPAYNPYTKSKLPNQEFVPTIADVTEQVGIVRVNCRDNGAKIEQAHLIYTLNGKDRYEEWFRVPMQAANANEFNRSLPKGTTHYFVNVIDENQFLVSYPSLKKLQRGEKTYTPHALRAKR